MTMTSLEDNGPKFLEITSKMSSKAFNQINLIRSDYCSSVNCIVLYCLVFCIVRIW